MNENLSDVHNMLPAGIKAHLKQISKNVRQEDRDNALEKLENGWMEKERIFDEKCRELNMKPLEEFSKDDSRGAVAMTHSGSLINIGPVEENRKVEYISIGIRTNVPPSAITNGASLKEDMTVGSPVYFEIGPVKSTSDVYKIAVCPEEMDVEEQAETLANATRILENAFTQVNENLQIEAD